MASLAQAMSFCKRDPTKDFDFLKLPPEIRSLIYIEMFSTNSGGILVVETEWGTTHMRAIYEPASGMLRTCRTVYEEARHHLKHERLTFRSRVLKYTYKNDIPKLGWQFTNPLYANIRTIVISTCHFNRIIQSIESLKEKMIRLRRIELITLGRVAYKLWEHHFPTVISLLTSPGGSDKLSRACGSDAEQGELVGYDLRKFRAMIRPLPRLIDTLGLAKRFASGVVGDSQDMGGELFPHYLCALENLDIEVEIRKFWILVDYVEARYPIKLVLETKYTLFTGYIHKVRLLQSYLDTDKKLAPGSAEEIPDIEDRLTTYLLRYPEIPYGLPPDNTATSRYLDRY